MCLLSSQSKHSACFNCQLGLGSRGRAAAVLSSCYFSPHIFLSIWCARFQFSLCCYFSMTAWWPSGSPQQCPVLKSTLWHVKGLARLREHPTGLARSPSCGREVHRGAHSLGLCFVFLLNCLEMAGLFPDWAENSGEEKGWGGNLFSSSLSKELWKREVCLILWSLRRLFFPHLISLETFWAEDAIKPKEAGGTTTFMPL